jgi:hypothetical protein
MRLILGAAVLAAVFLVPATASAAPACGTTPEQWVGTFTGTEQGHWSDPVGMTTTITLNAGSSRLVVDSVIGSADTQPLGTPKLVDGKLHWSEYWSFYHPLYGYFYGEDYYETTAVTCANGQVTAFSGIKPAPTGTFSLHR